MNKNYEVTVLVLTYNPVWDKLLWTLKSILLQDKVRFQLVIADDGSADNYFDQIKDYLAEKKFKDYKLVPADRNRGTVYNMWHAMGYCDGRYIKPISPGDMLNHTQILSHWIADLEKKHAQWSFADAVYFRFHQEQALIPVKCLAHPQNVKVYKSGDMQASQREYLLFNDICLGAATICQKKVMERYLEQICNKVIYAEDNIYRLMFLDGIPFSFYDSAAILYEYGSGISTNNKVSIWDERLLNDWNATNKIMLDRCKGNVRIKQDFIKITEQAGSGLSKIRLLCSVRGLFWNKLRKRLIKRMTPQNLSMEYINRINEY